LNLRRNKTLDESRKNLRICQMCDNVAVIGGKWCSEECKESYRQRSSEPYSRLKVLERDRGICAECGLDCQDLVRCRDRANKGWQQFVLIQSTDKKRTRAEAQKIYEAHRRRWVSKIIRIGIPEYLWKSGALWYSDHILPVYRGGGATDITNRQTLCWFHHTIKTNLEAKGRKLLAKSRKTVKHLKG